MFDYIRKEVYEDISDLFLDENCTRLSNKGLFILLILLFFTPIIWLYSFFIRLKGMLYNE